MQMGLTTPQPAFTVFAEAGEMSIAALLEVSSTEYPFVSSN